MNYLRRAIKIAYDTKTEVLKIQNEVNQIISTEQMILISGLDTFN